LISGEAEVSVDGEDKSRRSLGILRGGRFFGEMGVMTGAPRTASVTAHTDVECYRLEKNIFQELLRTRPALAEEISRIVAAREAGLHEAQHDMLENSTSNKASAYQELLQRVRKFVGLGN
jgi:CRP-like cAMP-binding protein